MASRHTYVTPQQAAIHALYVRHRSMSVVARLLGLSQIRVREALVQVQRNKMRDAGITPPPLREMLRGDVTTRFCVPRSENGGRPAKHLQDEFVAMEVDRIAVAKPKPLQRLFAEPAGGVQRLVVTTAECGGVVHRPFWRNLRAYADRVGAELAVGRIGGTGVVDDAEGLRARLVSNRIDVAGGADVALDARLPLNSSRPLDAVRRRRAAGWTVLPHPVLQLETLARLRSEGLRIQMTTGAVTLPRPGGAGPERDEVGAVVIEAGSDGGVHCRHLLARIDGDGTFQDLSLRARDGAVAAGCRVEAVTFGDVHHSQLDPAIAAATWGLGGDARRKSALVDRLRPRTMVFHDVVDFSARSHHDAGDPHRRFMQMARGGGDVRRELAEAAAFLAATRRTWSRSVVVGSNHDEALVRWLREADFRDDPLNAMFYLEASLALYRRLDAGLSADGLFGEVLAALSPDGLAGVRFLAPDENLAVAGVECSVHGHRAADGKRGAMPFFERLGIRATLGHVHRPTTRGGIYCTGVCQPRLHYARGPITAWAPGHVVTYATGARQHLIFNRGRFFA